MPISRPRSADASRAAIRAAARRRFGRDGFAPTTIRSVAADAGVDPALVMHYFGSKQGLFAAAAELDLQLPDLTDVPADEIVATLLPRFFDVWEGDAAFLPLLRASTTTPAAAERLRAVFVEQVAPTLAVVAVDRPAERAALVGAQLLGIAVARYVLKVPPLVAMSHEQLTRELAPVLQHYLTGP